VGTNTCISTVPRHIRVLFRDDSAHCIEVYSR